MIRDSKKIYGEVNSPKTIRWSGTSTIPANRYLIGTNLLTINTLSQAKSLLYSNASSEAKLFNYASSNNKLVGTNSLGQLSLFDRTLVPTVPPSGLQTVYSMRGGHNPSDPCTSYETLLSPAWYEVHIWGAGGGGGGGADKISSFPGGPYPNMPCDGAPGGNGARLKVLFKVETPTIVKMWAGCSGGNAPGIIQTVTDTPSQAPNVWRSATYSGNVGTGGDGGRSPLFAAYTGKASNGISVTENTSYNSRSGGTGINGGSEGGAVRVDLEAGATTVAVGGASGGGSNGPYGGQGGDFRYYPLSSGYSGLPGAGGGAGGGVGSTDGLIGGGNGGSVNIPNGSNSVIASGGTSYGAGGGGAGGGQDVATIWGIRGGGAGGGGGASYLECGATRIITGGGGGGAGGGAGDFAGWVQGLVSPASGASGAYLVENGTRLGAAAATEGLGGLGGTAINRVQAGNVGGSALPSPGTYRSGGYKGYPGAILLMKRVEV